MDIEESKKIFAAAERIEKFLAVRERMRGLDHKYIISVQTGSADEAHITSADLKMLASYAKGTL